EKIALDLGASFPFQSFKLFRRLDALSGCHHAEASSDGCNSTHDRQDLLWLRHILHERSVNFDLVEWKLLEIAERGVPGAKVVHRNPHAEASKLVEHRQRVIALLQQQRLSYFDLQPR